MNNIPPVTKNILIINVLMFLATIVFKSRFGVDISDYLGLHLFWTDSFNLFQPLSYMFMHSTFSHLFFNMFAVWMFGRILEQVWGPVRFLYYYIVCGVGAAFIQEAAQYIYYSQVLSAYSAVDTGYGVISMATFLNNMVTVGASGAVYAVLLGFGMSYPNERMFVFPLPFPVKAKYFVAGYAVIELLLGIANSHGDNVAHFAHLGGMAFGFALLMLWRKSR